MSGISGKDTKPEMIVRKYLFSKGLRYRKNDKRLPGSPDLVFPKFKTVVFVHGCFWHGHEGCKKSKLPESRKEFWVNKISKNIERDQKNYVDLQSAGWNVILVWQCDIATINKQKTFLPLLYAKIQEGLKV